MKVLGIIAEYNPFHNGHLYHINEAKRITGADFIVAVISGGFTQAGNISVLDKFLKADIAIKNGIDIVIELPVIYTVSSASYFANAAINILNLLGIVDYICFGSESSDINTLNNISHKIIDNDKDIWSSIRSQKKNISFAASRVDALKTFLSPNEINIISKSNDILGIEYLKTLININSNIIPYCIKRSPNYKSATYIRSLLENKDIKDISNCVPINVYDILRGTNISDDDMYLLIRYNILNKNKTLNQIKDITEGLENKLIKSATCSTSYTDFIFSLKSKRYQLSKIKRILINTLLDIKENEFKYAIDNNIFYAHVLKVSTNGKKLLPLLSKNSKIPIITSLSNNNLRNLNDDILKYLTLDIKAQNIYSIISGQEQNRDYTNKI